MSRLLFAAARGARIQEKTSILSFPAAKNRWATIAAYIPTADYKGDDYRIHPDDTHLQYGPISTALRKHAFGLPLTETCWFEKLLLYTDGDLYTLSPNDRYVFFLLMAECLADEGM